jgi:hypothetical protein
MKQEAHRRSAARNPSHIERRCSGYEKNKYEIKIKYMAIHG